MSFPLADWINEHEGVPHDLAQSGMKGGLSSVRPFLQRPPSGDPLELRELLAGLHRVAVDRIVLTPGATSANGLVIPYLFRSLSRRRSRRPRAALRVPEYPPLWDVAEGAGFRTVRGLGRGDLTVLSNPNNPEGTWRPASELVSYARARTPMLVDETFRQFTEAPSLASRGEPGLWTTSTFTKVFAADQIRVGFVIAPPGEGRAFQDHAELWADKVPFPSLGAATAILRHRTTVLREARQVFQQNLRALRSRLPSVPKLAAPVWFDRGLTGEGTEPFAHRAVRQGVLVCPGRYFRDPSGIRVCLTRRTFPRDLAAYLRLQQGLRSDPLPS